MTAIIERQESPLDIFYEYAHNEKLIGYIVPETSGHNIVFHIYFKSPWPFGKWLDSKTEIERAEKTLVNLTLGIEDYTVKETNKRFFP